jgi:5-formyltetrahydrofolate cyclo-ligase
VVSPADLDVVVVPALALGRDGSRLGYGGGYYDAFLAETPAARVGVAFAACLVPSVPSEPHDARLDAVVTEDEVVRVSAPA